MVPQREYPLGRTFDTLLDRLFSNWFSPFGGEMESLRMWDFGMTENDRELVVRAEVPGFEPNELDIQLNNDTLTIHAEKEKKSEGQEEYRRFHRVVTLPCAVDADKVEANYRNGVLELHIPRAPGAQPRRIQVQGAHAGQPAQPSVSHQNQASPAAETRGQQSSAPSGGTTPEKGRKN
jgi:HSP20 family protein